MFRRWLRCDFWHWPSPETSNPFCLICLRCMVFLSVDAVFGLSTDERTGTSLKEATLWKEVDKRRRQTIAWSISDSLTLFALSSNPAHSFFPSFSARLDVRVFLPDYINLGTRQNHKGPNSYPWNPILGKEFEKLHQSIWNKKHMHMITAFKLSVLGYSNGLTLVVPNIFLEKYS
jgi:hypothetical protein